MFLIVYRSIDVNSGPPVVLSRYRYIPSMLLCESMLNNALERQIKIFKICLLRPTKLSWRFQMHINSDSQSLTPLSFHSSAYNVHV